MHDSTFIAIASTWGAVIGILCGMMPMRLALKRDRVELGVGAMIICVLCGFIGGLLIAFPAALIATGFVSAMSKPKNTMYRERPRSVHSETSSGPSGVDWTALDPDAPPPALPSLSAPNPRRHRPV